jgi:hypothetical protein
LLGTRWPFACSIVREPTCRVQQEQHGMELKMMARNKIETPTITIAAGHNNSPVVFLFLLLGAPALLLVGASTNSSNIGVSLATL